MMTKRLPRLLTMRRFTRGMRARLHWFLETPRQRQMDAKLDALLENQGVFQKEMRLAIGQMTLPDTHHWAAGPARGEPRQGLLLPFSQICRQASMDTAYHHHWMQVLGLPDVYHRKQWEFSFILQALEERGVLQPGARGLGFGVGGERLPAYFAARGCQVTATDMATDDAVEAGWVDTHQHAAGKESFRNPTLCPDDVFDANVEFRFCDMNHVPEDLTGYDFCWSACALEHVGSLELGLAFIERSLRCLKPGGWAIHTTEFNLRSNTDTLESGGTSLFRRRDLEALEQRLTALGAKMAPLDLAEGFGAVDRFLDLPPYRNHPHLVLALAGYAITSVGLIVQAPL